MLILVASTQHMTSFLKKILIFPVKVYQLLISPLFPPSCRYQPTCSQYMIEAIEEWGPLRGLWMGIRRFASRHPWSEGGEDPVPKKERK